MISCLLRVLPIMIYLYNNAKKRKEKRKTFVTKKKYFEKYLH